MPFSRDFSTSFSENKTSRLANVAAQQIGFPPCVLFKDGSTSISSFLPNTANFCRYWSIQG